MEKNLNQVVNELTTQVDSYKLSVDFAEWVGRNFWHYTTEHWDGKDFKAGWHQRLAGKPEQFLSTKELFNQYLGEGTNWNEVSEGWEKRYHDKDNELQELKKRIEKRLPSFFDDHSVSQMREEPYNGREPYSSQVL